MSEQKQDLLQELAIARQELWAVLDTIRPDAEIYPRWRLLEFYAHIAGWEAIAFEVLHNHVAHLPASTYPYTDLDTANQHFVAERQQSSVHSVKLECEINRYAIARLLQDLKEVDFETIALQFPWGQNTIAEFLTGAIEHERDHTTELRQLKQAGKV